VRPVAQFGEMVFAVNAFCATVFREFKLFKIVGQNTKQKL